MSAAELGPSFVGCILTIVLTGITLGQGYVYIRWFPNERRVIRTVVLSILVVDVFQTGMAIGLAWEQFISCRRNTSYRCTVENAWETLVAIPVATLTTFGVQAFYCYRVWIVSANNRIITGLVAILAVASMILGFICTGAMVATGKTVTLYTNPYLPASYGASAACDIVITGSMIFFLREARTGVRRAGNRMQRMLVVFVQMGLLTSVTCLVVFIAYLVKPARWQALPSEILPKLYANSMLAVLNARKAIRDDPNEEASPEIIVPTIRTDIGT